MQIEIKEVTRETGIMKITVDGHDAKINICTAESAVAVGLLNKREKLMIKTNIDSTDFVEILKKKYYATEIDLSNESNNIIICNIPYIYKNILIARDEVMFVSRLLPTYTGGDT